MYFVLYLLIALVAFCIALVAYMFVLSRHEKAQLAKRAAAVLNPHLQTIDTRVQVPKRTIAGFSNIVHSIRLRLGFTASAKLRVRLGTAGFYDSQALDLYIGARVLMPIVLVALVSFFSAAFSVIAGAAGAGYLIPDFVLEQLVRRRRNRIRQGLPDTVDLLVICMDAGLAVDQAVQRTAEVLHVAYPDLCAELVHLGHLQQMGQNRVDAWKQLVVRTKSQDIEQVANMLNQAETFGTSISDSLHVLADALRIQRKQRAETRAAKSGIILLLPLVCFIFPVIFVVLLGPAMISIVNGFRSFGH
jgi:tight adherence protein C